MNLHHVLKSCLYSTVKNGSGGNMTFGFLPPHGVNLAADEEYTVFGNILDRMPNRRSEIAFAAAVDSGDIEIISTPSPIIVDTGNGDTRTFQSHNGALTSVAPCFDVSDSLDITIPV